MSSALALVLGFILSAADTMLCCPHRWRPSNSSVLQGTCSMSSALALIIRFTLSSVDNQLYPLATRAFQTAGHLLHGLCPGPPFEIVFAHTANDHPTCFFLQGTCSMSSALALILGFILAVAFYIVLLVVGALKHFLV